MSAPATNRGLVPSPVASWAIGAGLGLLGFASVWFRWEIPLFFNIDFMFASLFFLLALLLCGPGPGLLAATLTWIGAVLAWGSPWGFVTWVGEAAFVAAWTWRKPRSLPALATAYWVLLGAPILWLLSRYVRGMEPPTALAFTCKQVVNDIFNAVAATSFYVAVASLSRRRSHAPSLRLVLFTLLLTLGLVPSLITIVLGLRQKQRDEWSTLAQRTNSNALRARSTLSRWLLEREQTVASLARLVGDPNNGSPPVMQRDVESLHAIAREFQRMGVFDEREVSVAYSPPVDDAGRLLVGVNVSAMQEVQKLKREHDPFVANLTFALVGERRPILRVFAPIYLEGVYRGFAVGLLEPADIRAVLKSMTVDPDTHVTLLDRADRVVASTREDLPLMGQLARAPGALLPLGDDVVLWQPHMGNDENMVKWWHALAIRELAASEDFPWRVVVEVSNASVAASVSDVATERFVMLAVLAVLIVGISYLASRRLVGPLAQLEANTVRLHQRLTSPAELTWPDSSIDEVRGLIVNFKGMTEALVQSFARQAELNATLEQRVDARTAELARSEENFRILFEHAADSVLLLEIQPGGMPVILDMNAEALRKLGYSREELIGKPIGAIDPEASLSTPRERQISSEPIRFEVRHRCKDGSLRDFECMARLVNIGGKDLVISAERDVTDRYRAMKELSASEEKFSKLFQLSPLIMLLSDLEGGAVFDINRSFEVKTGFGRDVIGKRAEDIGLLSGARWSAYSAAVVAGALSFRDMTWTKADGSVLPLNVSAVVLPVGGKPLLLTIGEDISEHKQAEQERALLREQLHQTEKMRAIGTLAGGIAHDFNNILGVILGHAELLRTDRQRDADSTESLDAIQASALRARDLVKQILAFSRKSTEGRTVHEVQPIVREATTMLRSTIPATVEMVTELDAAHAKCLTNPTHVHQIVMNLCVNAAQAMGNAGRITVALRAVNVQDELAARVPELRTGAYVVLTVADTGPGIAPDVLPRIFEPFFTTKEVGRGTGLGLSVVQGIVSQNEGAISVSSEVGRGSVFSVYLPVTDAPDAAKVPVDDVPRGDGRRVLVVDDEPALVRMIQRTLLSLGYEVVGKTTPFEALETFRAAPAAFDAVLTDQTMPGMTGDELAAELLAIRPDVPIVLCSGFSERVDESTATSLGLAAFMLKPLQRQAIAHTLKRVIGRPASLPDTARRNG